MSTPAEPGVTEPIQPVSKKQQRKRKNAVAVVEEKPVELIEDISEPEPDPFTPAYLIEEGYSLSMLLKALAGGVGLGAIAMTLLFGYVRAKEIQRAQEEFAENARKEFILMSQAPLAKDQPLARSPSEEPPASNV